MVKIYLPFTIKKSSIHVGKYTSPMDGMGISTVSHHQQYLYQQVSYIKITYINSTLYQLPSSTTSPSTYINRISSSHRLATKATPSEPSSPAADSLSSVVTPMSTGTGTSFVHGRPRNVRITLMEWRYSYYPKWTFHKTLVLYYIDWG